MRYDKINELENADMKPAGGDLSIPASDYSGSRLSAKHRCYDVIRARDSKSLKFSPGGDLASLQAPFTPLVWHDMNGVYAASQMPCLRRRKRSSAQASHNQLTFFVEALHDEDTDPLRAFPTSISSQERDVSTHLRVVPPVRPSEVTPLASLFDVRDLSSYPALAALSLPNKAIKINLRQAELEAASLRFPNEDPDVVKRIVGLHADSTISTYSGHLSRYGRMAAEIGEPTAPFTPRTLARYLWKRVDGEKKVNFPQLKRELEALSATMTMLGIASCTSDLFVRKTMQAIGRQIGRKHDGRAKPFMARDLRRALPWLEELAKTEPERALIYLLVLVIGISTMLRREELASIMIDDLRRTRHGFVLSVFKTKTRRPTDPPAYIHLGRVHDERVCPVRLIETYLQRYGFHNGTLFRRMSADGSPGESRMAPHRISKIVGDVAEAAHLGAREDFTAHSLRGGGINSAHEAGMSLDEIRAISLQSDAESTLRYIDKSVCTRPMTAAIFA